MGHMMGNTFFNILSYADDAVLLADCDDNLQKLLFKFDQAEENLNVSINTNKIKTITICQIRKKKTKNLHNENAGRPPGIFNIFMTASQWPPRLYDCM